MAVSMPFDYAARPRLARGARLTWDEVGGRHLLLVPEGLVALNGSAAAVLELCDGQRTVGDIVAALTARYPDAPASLGSEVSALLEGIAQKGFVVDARPA